MSAIRWLILCLMLGACVAPISQPPKVARVPLAQPVPKPPIPPRRVQLAQLGSYSPAQILTLFGAPSLDRLEGDTRVLQFTSGSCVSDMVFNQAGALVHVEARAKTGTPIDIQPCLDSFEQNLSGS